MPIAMDSHDHRGQPPLLNEEIELSIVLPCLNEAETIAFCVNEASNFLKRSAVRGEVVIGDNGSSDGSQNIARALGARVIDIPIRGYGAALSGAIRASRGKYVVMADSDGSYDLGNLEPFLENLRAGYDLVMGNRFLGGIHPGAMPFKNRYFGNPVLSGIGRLFFNAPSGDFHCGLRGFSRKAFIDLELQTTGMEFASEMVIKSVLRSKAIAEVPTILRPDGRSRPPHLKPWRDGWRHLRFMLLFSPRWLFFYPGVFLLSFGLLGTTALFFTPIQIFGAILDVNSMVYSATAILIGHQSISFAVMARMVAIRFGVFSRHIGLEKLAKVISLEKGILVGLFFLLLGLVGAGYSVMDWRAKDFGVLNPRESLRLVIVSGTSIAMGFQIMSFLFGVLRTEASTPSSCSPAWNTSQNRSTLRLLSTVVDYCALTELWLLLFRTGRWTIFWTY